MWEEPEEPSAVTLHKDARVPIIPWVHGVTTLTSCIMYKYSRRIYVETYNFDLHPKYSHAAIFHFLAISTLFLTSRHLECTKVRILLKTIFLDDKFFPLFVVISEGLIHVIYLHTLTFLSVAAIH